MKERVDLEKKAKQRAMNLLARMDRTESQLRQKLRQDQYPEEVIEAAVSYVASFGYIGDENYVKRYVESRHLSKSKRAMKQALMQKGVSKELIETVFDEQFADFDELETIRRLVERKHFDADTATQAEKKKLQDSLLRKGFRYEDILKVLQVSLWNA